MARARTIKPGFFQNEFMASKAPEVQLLFLGLLTIADRDGRLEDRPLKIKGQVFPYQDIDVNAALQSLATIDDPFQDRPFIYRYTIGGRRYIQIVNWDKHQNVHPNEVASIIPPMPEVESEPLAKCHEPIANNHEPLVTLHDQSAPMVGSRAALTSFTSIPSCTSLTNKGARASESVEKENENFLTRFPSVTVPKFILDDTEWFSWVDRWFKHLMEKSALDFKPITDTTVQAQVDSIAGRSKERCIEVLAYSIESHGWKPYWDHKPPPPEPKPDEPRKKPQRQVMSEAMRKKLEQDV